MSASINESLKNLASVDLFGSAATEETFVGRPFYFDYTTVRVLVNDAWKQKVGGIPSGAFLFAIYDRETDVPEVVLLRVLGPCKLPSDNDVTAAMVDYYKENLPNVDLDSQKLDSYTRYEFQFSGLECRILGSFYRSNGETRFAADIDNFFSANNYSVYKPGGQVLEYVVNFREGTGVPGGPGDQRIGVVRYSASQRHPATEEVPVYVSAIDYLGKRTALFGMTRTGKSNTLKKVIQATAELASPGGEIGAVGQIIFDINGEYANDNQQDEGTAIYQLYADKVSRYSIVKKPGFSVLKLNFFVSIQEGMELIRSNLADDTAVYTKAFLNVDWTPPDPSDISKKTRYDRRLACYKCILSEAGFTSPNQKVYFKSCKEINASTKLDPSKGVSLDEAKTIFAWIWENYATDQFFLDYKKDNGRDWADDDLQNLMRFLTRKAKPGPGSASEAGYRKLIPTRELHTSTLGKSFEEEIVLKLRAGEIVIVDLSQGSPVVQAVMSERLCNSIFLDSMNRFINNEASNYIQLYFEEAHNLFPKRTDTDLTLVYNRIAKEGAKLNLGLIYATQEVSSISANVLKNTQNWFVSHLNNEDELKEIGKFYDYKDFLDSLRVATDKGFIRMKTYSNAFTVPVQIDRFTAVGE